MRLLTGVKIAIVAAATMAVALVAVVKSIDFNQYKHVLTEQVRAATGREFVIDGPLELRMGLVPSVVATDVRFANMQGGSRPLMAGISRIEADVALVPLLARQVQVRRLVLVGADILLETDGKGRPNWRFDGGSGAVPEGDAPPTRFDIHELRIKDSRLAIRDGESGAYRLVRIAHLSMLPQPGGAQVDLKAKGDVDGMAVDLAGTMGGLASLGGGKPWPVRVGGSVDGMTMAVEGAVGDLPSGNGIDLRLTLAGDELARPLAKAGVDLPPVGPFKLAARLHDHAGKLAANEIDAAIGHRGLVLSATGAVHDLVGLAGIRLDLALEGDSLARLSPFTGELPSTLPSTGPFKASASVTDRPDGWSFAKAKATLGGSDLSGDLHLDPGERPRLSGTLHSRVLVLADILGHPSHPAAPARPSDDRLFPAEALPLEGLDALDADLAFTIDRLESNGMTLTDFGGRVVLDRGVLAVEPVRAGLAGGTLVGRLRIDGRDGKVPELAVRLAGKGVELGRLFEGRLTGGPTDLDLDVKGRGASMREIMADLSGNVMLKTGEGRIHNTAINWAGDVVFQILATLNPLARTDDTTRLRCAVVNVSIADGKATTRRGIAVETGKVNVVASGTIDLGTEAVDLGISPRGRQGINVGSMAALTRVGGTLSRPSLVVDAAGTARTAASVGAAVATGGLSLLGELLFDTATADRAPCKTAAAG